MNGSFIRLLFQENVNRTKLHALCQEHQQRNWAPHEFLFLLKHRRIGDPVMIDRLVASVNLNTDIVFNDKPFVLKSRARRQRRTLAQAFVEGRNAAMKEMDLVQGSELEKMRA